MAFSHIGAVGSASSKTGNQSSIVMNVDNTVEVNNIIVLCVSKDNAQTTFVDNSEFTSVTDSQSNTWIKAIERTNAANSKASTVGAIFYCVVTTELVGATDTITVNFEPDSANDASAVTADEFTFDSAKTLTVVGTDAAEADVVTGAGNQSVSGLNNVEHLSIICSALESGGDTPTAVSGVTLFTAGAASTTGGGDASNQEIAGGFEIETATTVGLRLIWNDSGDVIGLIAVFDEVGPPTGFPQAFDHLAMGHNQ